MKRPLRRKNALFSWFSLLECLRKRTRRIRILSLKQRSIMWALRKIRVFVMNVAMMAIEGGIAINILQP